MKLFKASLLLMILLMYSCSNEEFEMANLEVQSRSNLEDARGGLLLPDGTQIENAQDYINIKLPDGYSFVGENDNAEAITSTSGTWKCDCIKGTGKCTPTETKKTVGCNTEKENPCKECKGELVSSSNEGFNERWIKKDGSGEFESFDSKGIYFYTDFKKYKNDDWVTEDVISQHKSEFEDLLAELNKETKDALVWSPINFMGSKMLVQVPLSSMSSGGIYDGEVDGKTTCTGCDGKCKLKKAALGKVRYCDGCNSGCSISW